MQRRLAIASLALLTALGWWFYARHLDGIWAVFPIGAILAGGACGICTSWRRWWLPFVPLPVLAGGGIALSFAFSNNHAFGSTGDWTAWAVVAFGGIWYGLIATAAVLVVLAIRGAAYSVEYFG